MPETSPDFRAYEASVAAGRALAATLAPANRTALFDALAAAGIARVVVAFDGAGDGGQIESIDGFDADNATVPLPAAPVPFSEAAFDGASIERHMLPASQVIEALAYDFLGQTHDGWEIGDGAYGEFTFAVAEGSIRLDYNERHVESTYHEHEL